MTAGAKAWNVRPNEFPFGVSETVLGIVNGADRGDAQRKAEDLYGRAVIVEQIHAGSNSPEEGGPRSRYTAQRSLNLAPARPMTLAEGLMLRAVASCELLRQSPHKAAMRMLHARSLRPDRNITEVEARLLRDCVQAMAAKLPPAIVQLAGGAS